VAYRFETNVSRQEEIPLRCLLSDIRLKAVALHRPLDEARRYLETVRFKKNRRTFWDLDVVVLNNFPLSNAAHILKELSALIDACNKTLGAPRKTGRKRGSRNRGTERYPGLDELIWDLEITARCEGGGFTVHRKQGAKGTLIRALDWLRNRLLTDPDLKHLADFIPPPGRHPVATYEYYVRVARDTARKAAALRTNSQ
jgi:hypothetical protein